MPELKGTEIEKLRELYKIDKGGFCPYFNREKAMGYLQKTPVTDGSGLLSGVRIKERPRTRCDCVLLGRPVVGVDKIIRRCHDNYWKCRAYAADERARQGMPRRSPRWGDKGRRKQRVGLWARLLGRE